MIECSPSTIINIRSNGKGRITLHLLRTISEAHTVAKYPIAIIRFLHIITIIDTITKRKIIDQVSPLTMMILIESFLGIESRNTVLKHMSTC